VDGPALPYAKAFVVQFAAETDAQLEHAAGRIEHLLTGRRLRFASILDLLGRIAALLADDRSEAASRGGPPPRARRGRGPKLEPGAGADRPTARAARRPSPQSGPSGRPRPDRSTIVPIR
jgi:hypothetical protein